MKALRSENPPLGGNDLALEPLVEAHARELLPLYAEADVWTYVDTPPPKTLAGLSARHRRLEARRSRDGTEQWLNWAVRSRGEMIGFVEATVRSTRPIEIAYFTGKRFWNRGHATAAVRIMLAFLESRFAGATFEATVDVRNIPSIRLLARLGFVMVDDADLRNLRFHRPADIP